MNNKVTLEDMPCVRGCPRDDEVILVGRDRLHDLPGQFTVVKCRACGLMRTNPRPTPETIGYYYPDDYGPYVRTRVTLPPVVATTKLRRWLRSLSQRVFESNAYRLPSVKVGRLLEIGCASGSFLHKMASAGWQVEGIEISEQSAKAARELGYQVHTGSLEDAPSPTYRFDLIVGWMVIEHLHDPIRGLQKLHEWANPEAYLVLSVPNTSSLDFWIFKERWYDLHLPAHLYHFTPKTLAGVLAAGGWQIEKIHFQRALTVWFVSLGYVLKDKGYQRMGAKLIHFSRRLGRWNQILFPLIWVMSLLKLTGRMTVWARKTELLSTTNRNDV